MFLVTYDLHKARNYSRLYQLMAAWRATRITESLWLLVAPGAVPGAAATVRDIVTRTVDDDDTIVVMEIKQGSDWAVVNGYRTANAALSAYVTPAKKAA